MDKQLFFNSPRETLERYKTGEINEEEAFGVLRSFPDAMEIPRRCFENQTKQQEVSEESDEKFQVVGLNFEGKLTVEVKDAMFPMKTYVDTKMLVAANIVKSLFIEPIKLLSMWQFIPAVAISVFSIKSLEKIIESFNRIAWRVISQFILKDEHLTDFTLQSCFLIYTFLVNLGISEHNSLRFATIVSHLIEYDNAYRFRIEDILTETTLERLKSPREELKRLSGIFAQRDTNPMVVEKIDKLMKLISIALLIPEVKRAFLKTLEVTELRDLQLDDTDKYWLCMRKDYHAMNMNYEERQEYAKSRGWTFPNMLPIQSKNDKITI